MPELKKKRSRKIWIIALLLFVVAGAGTGAYFKRRETPILIQVEKVERRDVTEFVVASGRIQPVVQVKISPEVSGEIIDLPVKEGQAVKKGDLLVRIKPDFYIASRNQAEASYKSSVAAKATTEANLRKADAEFKRNQDLLRHKLVYVST